ncbi:MAG: hypothetical protein H8E17_18405 [Deltaproteobacteria bacterium]|nr:hypothetical protein [Deltaproteobacteria bacterium]
MIVKCIDNRIEKVCTKKTSEALFDTYHRLKGEDEYIQRGRSYIVYAMFIANDVKWYLLRLREDTWYPIWYPECFFEIVEGSPSRHWIQTRKYSNPRGGRGCGMLYAFYEYTEIDNFYDNLIDKCEEEVEIFKQVVQKIKDEAVY